MTVKQAWTIIQKYIDKWKSAGYEPPLYVQAGKTGLPVEMRVPFPGLTFGVGRDPQRITGMHILTRLPIPSHIHLILLSSRYQRDLSAGTHASLLSPVYHRTRPLNEQGHSLAQWPAAFRFSYGVGVPE